MLQSKTLFGSGILGNSQPVDTSIAVIINLLPGRYKIWGRCRHTLADGIKLTSPVIINFSQAAGESVDFGPFVVDVASSAIGIGISLRLATGGADTASANLYAELISGSTP